MENNIVYACLVDITGYLVSIYGDELVTNVMSL